MDRESPAGFPHAGYHETFRVHGRIEIIQTLLESSPCMGYNRTVILDKE